MQCARRDHIRAVRQARASPLHTSIRPDGPDDRQDPRHGRLPLRPRRPPDRQHRSRGLTGAGAGRVSAGSLNLAGVVTRLRCDRLIPKMLCSPCKGSCHEVTEGVPRTSHWVMTSVPGDPLRLRHLPCRGRKPCSLARSLEFLLYSGPISSRPISILLISDVPAPISSSFASLT